MGGEAVYQELAEWRKAREGTCFQFLSLEVDFWSVVLQVQ